MDKAWFDQVRPSALGWTTSVETTYDVCRTALERGIPGDFVECGVYRGAQSAVMAKATLDHIGAAEDPRYPEHIPGFRRVHLFDSFEGIPAAGPEDVEFLAAKHPAGLASCSLEEVKGNMERWGIPDSMLVYHVGMFERTIPEATVIRSTDNLIAVLRLDSDLYQSTLICMEHLYPLVSPGGYVIVDDFDLSGCRQAVLERIKPAPITFRKPTNDPCASV
jgi:O-methyltransferase